MVVSVVELSHNFGGYCLTSVVVVSFVELSHNFGGNCLSGVSFVAYTVKSGLFVIAS